MCTPCMSICGLTAALYGRMCLTVGGTCKPQGLLPVQQTNACPDGQKMPILRAVYSTHVAKLCIQSAVCL